MSGPSEQLTEPSETALQKSQSIEKTREIEVEEEVHSQYSFTTNH